ncbi:hypothetical protein E2C01_078187 [Portunus trituberculatus]|uniref:Uncharacterized protein n=1 Tax=Portunus trituberculatus TaxID=210409 RepID=A0A5B7IPE5_PORTR|nr:hypothetical protein [Portunus trituberculatus]
MWQQWKAYSSLRSPARKPHLDVEDYSCRGEGDGWVTSEGDGLEAKTGKYGGGTSLCCLYHLTTPKLSHIGN